MTRYRSSKHRVTTPAATVLKRRITKDKVQRLREKLAKKQNYICPICQRSLKRLDNTLDHCHKTGYVRGVLCRNCNGLEGKLTTILMRLDVGKIGFDQIIMNLAKWRHPDNLKKKWIHHNAETLQEQKERQNKRRRDLNRRKQKG